MTILEKLYIKCLGNTKGYDFNILDWDVMSLQEHWDSGQPLTKAERHAKKFLEDIGEVLERWHPTEKWKRPYGDELNEKRNLH
jgi:hypothetical protein